MSLVGRDDGRVWYPRAALLLASLAAASLALAAPPKIDPHRKVWEADAGNVFTQLRNGTWTELNLQGKTNAFTPVETTDEYIELVDNNRNISVRLFADHCDARSGQGEFKPFRKGHWRTSGKPAPKPKRPDAGAPSAGLQRSASTARPSNGIVRLFYFVPQDRTPIDRYAERIGVVMAIADEVYRSEFHRRGWKTTGLPLERDANKDMVVHLVRGKLNAADYTGAPNYNPNRQWEAINKELVPQVLAPRRELAVVLMETYDPGPWDVEWPGGTAVGGRYTADGGLALFSAWILRDEFTAANVELQKQLFLDATPIVGRKARGSGRPNSPRFEFIEDGYGAVIHEIGHALGLPHDHREPSSIMGNGFRILARNFDPSVTVGPRAQFSDLSAMLLNSSRFLNPDLDMTDNTPPQVALQAQDAGSGPLTLAIQAVDDRALRGIVVIDSIEDSVAIGEPMTGKQYSKTISLPVKRNPAGRADVRVFVVDGGGQMNKAFYPANAAP